MEPLKDYSWLVESRSKIQRLLADLYGFVNTNRNKLKTAPVERAIFGLLVGASFSLWRAAFLVGTARTWPAILDDAEEFLELVVRDNAINYPQDRATQVWSVGYYLNNARYRVVRMRRRLESLTEAECIGRIVEFQAFDELPEMGAEEVDPKFIWDKCHDALTKSFAMLRASRALQ